MSIQDKKKSYNRLIESSSISKSLFMKFPQTTFHLKNCNYYKINHFSLCLYISSQSYFVHTVTLRFYQKIACSGTNLTFPTTRGIPSPVVPERATWRHASNTLDQTYVTSVTMMGVVLVISWPFGGRHANFV